MLGIQMNTTAFLASSLQDMAERGWALQEHPVQEAAAAKPLCCLSKRKQKRVRGDEEAEMLRGRRSGRARRASSGSLRQPPVVLSGSSVSDFLVTP